MSFHCPIVCIFCFYVNARFLPQIAPRHVFLPHHGFPKSVGSSVGSSDDLLACGMQTDLLCSRLKRENFANTWCQFRSLHQEAQDD